ncbi:MULTISPECIES: hypothetical protein [unclassified Bilifractor]|uniref:hypothetical protein n=1 Tax=unclassified Bilifractor TaxID=2815795 RepID=UPI003F8FBE28
MMWFVLYLLVLIVGAAIGYQIGAAKKEKRIESLEDRIDTLERQVHLNEQIREKRESK